MLTIAVINSKGGTGKTTTAVYLAVAARRQHPEWAIGLIDADSQSSAIDWYEVAQNNEDRMPFTIIQAKNSLDLSYDADLLIIDTAPGDGTNIAKAAKRADVVIIPTEAETMALTRAKVTADAVGNKGWLLFTKTRRSTKIFSSACEAVNTLGLRRFATTIPDSVKYKSYGTVPKDLGAYSELWLELQTKIGE